MGCSGGGARYWRCATGQMDRWMEHEDRLWGFCEMRTQLVIVQMQRCRCKVEFDVVTIE
jgi:hypothetical protein